MIIAVGAGLIVGIFVTAPLGTIVAPLVAVSTFISISCYGFHKADKNNPIIMEYGTPEFKTESENTFSSRITQRFTHLKDFFVTKPSKASEVFHNASSKSSLFPPVSNVSANQAENEFGAEMLSDRRALTSETENVSCGKCH